MGLLLLLLLPEGTNKIGIINAGQLHARKDPAHPSNSHHVRKPLFDELLSLTRTGGSHIANTVRATDDRAPIDGREPSCAQERGFRGVRGKGTGALMSASKDAEGATGLKPYSLLVESICRLLSPSSRL